jgi:hypothetical protein
MSTSSGSFGFLTGPQRRFESLAAMAYNNLSIIASEEKDFAQAREWCMKSLAIKMKQGNARGVSASFHQLGRVAELERNFADARGGI